MPHPPHRLADGSADVHDGNCPRCLEIWGRMRRRHGKYCPPSDVAIPITKATLDLSEIDFFEKQLDAEDAQEAANKEAK